MKNKKSKVVSIFLTLGFSLTLILSCSDKKIKNISQQADYKVKKTTSPITIDGKLDESIWQKAESRNFDHYFDVVKPTDEQKTTFRMLWDEENIYLFYECEDQYITARETVRDGAPYFDDCAEIFLSPVPEVIDMHYGFEINLYKTSNDFIFLYNFYKNQKMPVKGFNPPFEVEFVVNGTINDNSDIDKGWTMEMAIPIHVFLGPDQYHPIKEGTLWRFMALRQDRNDIDGERRAASTIFPTNKDVHEPGVFGLLEFVN